MRQSQWTFYFFPGISEAAIFQKKKKKNSNPFPTRSGVAVSNGNELISSVHALLTDP
jgi:hypothetical protein